MTCLGYLRGILEQLTARALPTRVVTESGEIAVVMPWFGFTDYLLPLADIAGYATGDARVSGALLRTLSAVADTAARLGTEGCWKHCSGRTSVPWSSCGGRWRHYCGGNDAAPTASWSGRGPSPRSA